MCFDETQSNTGWALLKVSAEGIHVPFCGLIDPRVPTGTTGFSWSFGLAPQLFHEASKVLKRIDPRIPVAMEMPSVVGMRTESALIAANVLCCVLSELGREAPEVISRQTVLTNLVGYVTQNKTVTNAAVDRIVDSHAKPWNEHVRDAVAIGLEYLREDQP
jgi:Holliday junction resolvasome RuvABC endonuclease subunit